MTTTKQKIVSSTGLVQIPNRVGWMIGYIPAKGTLCIGSICTSGLADIFNEGETVIIRFNENGMPSQVMMKSKEAEEYELQDGEVRAKIGSYFVANSKTLAAAKQLIDNSKRFLFWQRLNKKPLKVYLRFQRLFARKHDGKWLRGLTIGNGEVNFNLE